MAYLQKIRRVRGKVWWAKRRRKIVRRDNGKVVEFEEVKYVMLMMVLCDREGRVLYILSKKSPFCFSSKRLIKLAV